MQLSLADFFAAAEARGEDKRPAPHADEAGAPPDPAAHAAAEGDDENARGAWLNAELEAALLRELRANYDWENHARFRNRLRPPMFALSEAAGRWGRWISATRTLELARHLVLERPWPEVLGVLLHEMAHQYVDEVLRAGDEAAHGEVFRKVCEERGIDSRAAGPPVPQEASSAEVDRVLERIRKLLALASSENQHEAELAMRKAHELMLRHNIEAAAAHASADYEIAHLGDPTKRGNRVDDAVMFVLLEYFFVKVIRIPVYLPRLGKHGKVFEISGTRANVEMAKHVYAFLLATAERLWNENRADHRVRNGRDRLTYQAGVIRGFQDKLGAERAELRGTGLIWRGDSKLDDFYHARHPRISSVKRTVRLTGAHDAGREAGRTIVLHRPIEHGGSSGGPKLLR